MTFVTNLSPWRPREINGVLFEHEVTLPNDSIMLDIVRHLKRAGIARIDFGQPAATDQGIPDDHRTAIYVATDDVEKFRELYAAFKAPVLAMTELEQNMLMGFIKPPSRRRSRRNRRHR